VNGANVAGLIVSAVLTIFLLIALLLPERF
jgi:K+-transporting ATPase KdpF subunit